jgi:mono/diheme cytochrome c family protein
MRFFLAFLFGFPLFAADSFITMEEYARQLYQNPRGIGCFHCHGDDGKGKTVAQYRHKKESRSFEGPPIHKIGYRTFYKALNSRVRGMPRYFLTDSEIKALYYYVQEKKPKTAEKGSNGSK